MKYGRLEIIEPAICIAKSGKERPGYLCKCDCGNFKVVGKDDLIEGKIKSCGCLIREFKKTKIGNKYALSKRSNENAYNKLPHYKRIRSIWKNMRSRCGNNKATSYEIYGGRGIRVCEEWNNFMNFYRWATKNGYGEDLSIDRINVNGNYEPSNCRWATFKEQSRNKRTNRNLFINGKVKCVADWCNELGISREKLIKKCS